MTFHRSMLFVPGTRRDMIEKAARSGADAVCLDLEDSVGGDRKDEARGVVIQALREVDFGGRTRIVRVNALDTPWTYRDVVDVVEGAGHAVDRLMLPKAGGAADVAFIDTLLTQVEARMGHTRRTGVQAQIESAAGFLHVAAIAGASPRLTTLIFGAGDYAASMRMPLVNIGVEDAFDAAVPGHRWHAVMHAIVAAARAHGLECWDGPYADYKDDAGLGRASALARAMGFDGKQCIHPSQLGAVNLAFTPAADEVARARAVVAAYEGALASGRGAVGLGGIMIDAVNLRMARHVLDAHDAIAARGRQEEGHER